MEEYVEKGEILSEFDDIEELALYIFKEQNEKEDTRAWKRILSNLEENSEDLEEDIEELRELIGED